MTARQDKVTYKIKWLIGRAKAMQEVNNKVLITLALQRFDISLPTARRYARLARRNLFDH